MTTLLGSAGSRMLPPLVQMYSQPLHTPPSYWSPWKTKPLSMPWSCAIFMPISFELGPGLGGLRIAGLLQEIRPVVEEARVREPRHAVDLAVVHRGTVWAQAGTASCSLFGNLSVTSRSQPFAANWAGQITSAPITSMSPPPAWNWVLSLSKYAPRVGRHLPVLDLEVLALLVELVDQALQGAAGVGPHGEDQVARAAAAAAASRAPQQRRPGEPGAAELQELPPVHPPSGGHAGSRYSTVRHSCTSLSPTTQRCALLMPLSWSQPTDERRGTDRAPEIQYPALYQPL